MTDRGAEWQDFSAILEQGLKQLRTISQWQTLEREQRISGRDREERPQHNREREWRAPNFNAPILPDDPNPPQFKRYREDMVSWFNAGGPDCPRTMARALLIKDLPESIRGKISDKITTENSLKRNLEIIEEFVLEAYPKYARQAKIYSQMNHDSETRYRDKIHAIIQAVKDTELLTLSSNQIVTGMLIQLCTNKEMNRWLADNEEELMHDNSVDKFYEKVIKQDRIMCNNRGLNYTGLGSTKPAHCIKEVSTIANIDWMKKYPCFVCGTQGHIHHIPESLCPSFNSIPKCSIGDCTRTHNALAHKNLMDFMASKKKTSTPHTDNTPPNIPHPITPRTGAKKGTRRPKRRNVKGVEGAESESDQTDDGSSQPENEDEEDRKPHSVQRIDSDFDAHFWKESTKRLQRENEALRKASSPDQ